LEASLGVVVRRRQAIDEEVSGAGEGFRIIRVESKGARERRLRLAQAPQLLQRRRAVVMGLNRARLHPRRLLGARQRAGEVLLVIALGGAIEQQVERARRIAALILREAAQEAAHTRFAAVLVLDRPQRGALSALVGPGRVPAAPSPDKQRQAAR